ncbi:Ig-like domain-containing protein, partial [Pseudomonas paraeruginosa]|uniref:Ig-like domain-containing protein n=1 Tax=Pseudomonas paraeruginosa TaxID=2994495 RepID=UPI0034D60499
MTRNIAANRTFFAIDPDGDNVTYHVGSGHPAHGDLGIDPVRGSITYTPEEDYLGADQFTLEAHDAHGNVSVLTVNVTVKPPATLISTTGFFFDRLPSTEPLEPDGHFVLHQIDNYGTYIVDR